ncbi:hypothetical protein NS220_05355 [Microbacterium testaceum]|uniref:Lipopolysaccharide biosynthesis protein n=1 Tax=Microbacterium testaceum TaxID=2033 RepID=A0A147EZ96_MICTE|nr:DUF4192 family protein [Microbacterium testaceum]KTR95695.1 hypothetical protein NS220_05355 [Microbacterium testaceum]
MSTVIRASSPLSLLALVPRLLGCTPRRSLVLVPFAESRSLAALRVDLPADDNPDLPRIASTLIGMACKVPLTDAVTVVIYTDDDVADRGMLPHSALVDAVLERAHICGLRVVEALVAGANGWGSYRDPSVGGAHTLDEITAAGPDVPESFPEHDQVAAAALPVVDLAETERMARALEDVDLLLDVPRRRKNLSVSRRRSAEAILDELSDPPALFESVLEPLTDTTGRHRLASLAFALERPLLRDVALMQWVGDIAAGDAAFHAQTRFPDGEGYPQDIARPMWGEGAIPDLDRLLVALDRCRRVAATAPRSRRPGALAACAWLAWATGRSTHAAFYAESALEIDPAHGLSGIVLTLTDNGRLPEWLFERTPRRARGRLT